MKCSYQNNGMAQISLTHNIKEKNVILINTTGKQNATYGVTGKQNFQFIFGGFEWIKVAFCRSENFIVMDWTNLHVPF